MRTMYHYGSAPCESFPKAITQQHPRPLISSDSSITDCLPSSTARYLKFGFSLEGFFRDFLRNHTRAHPRVSRFTYTQSGTKGGPPLETIACRAHVVVTNTHTYELIPLACAHYTTPAQGDDCTANATNDAARQRKCNEKLARQSHADDAKSGQWESRDYIPLLSKGEAIVCCSAAACTHYYSTKAAQSPRPAQGKRTRHRGRRRVDCGTLARLTLRSRSPSPEKELKRGNGSLWASSLGLV